MYTNLWKHFNKIIILYIIVVVVIIIIIIINYPRYEIINIPEGFK